MTRYAALAALTLFALGCPGIDRGSDADAGAAYERVSMPVHCWSTLPAAGLFPLAGDDLVASYANLTFISHDEGRTFERTVGTMVRPDVTYRSGLAASLGVFPIGVDGDFVSLSGLYGASRLAGPEDTFRGDEWLVVSHEGVTRDLLGKEASFTLANGTKAGFVWEVSDALRIAGEGVFLYASHDQGQSWEVIGWRVERNGYPTIREDVGVAVLAFRDDLAIVSDHRLSNRHYAVRPGEKPVDLGIGASIGRDIDFLTTDVGFYEDGIIFVTSPEGGRQIVAQNIDGSDRRTWAYPAGAAANVDFVEDTEGTLWMLPRYISFTGEKPVIVRFRAGAEGPEIVDLDFGPAGFAGVEAAVARADGRLLFSVRPDAKSRHFSSTMLCEVGPGVTQGIEPLVVEPLSAALENPGQVVRVARVADGTTVSDRFHRTPAGKVYATNGNALRVGPPDMPLLFSSAAADSLPADGSLPATEGYRPDTILSASDTMVETSFWFPSQLNDAQAPRTQFASWDLTTGETLSRGEFPFGNDQVFSVQEVFEKRLLTTRYGTWHSGELYSIGDRQQRTKLPRELIVGQGHGVRFNNSYAYERALQAQDRPAVAIRFNPAAERVPEINDCLVEPPLPSYCLTLEDADIVAARFDANGDLYVLDFRHGRVMLHPKGAGADEWIKVAEGFASPSDLRIESRDGKTVVLVYDADVFAFVPSPDRVAVAWQPPEVPVFSDAELAADTGERDLFGCMLSGGPCVDFKASGGVLSGDGTLCIGGTGFGEAGRLEFDGEEVPTLGWSDSEVCFSGTSLPATSDGLLTLVAASGARSAPVAWHAPSAFGDWQIPAVVTASTPIVITGSNLKNGTGLAVAGGIFASATDTRVELFVPETGEVTVSIGQASTSRRVEVVPEVVKPCRGGPAQGCELVATGLGSAEGTVKIAGLDAEVLDWSPSRVSLNWPAGLSAGDQALEVTTASGQSGQSTATLLDNDIHILIDGAGLGGLLSYAQARPALTPFGLLMGTKSYSQYTPYSMLVGVTAADEPWRMSLGAVLGGTAVHVLEYEGDTLLFGRTNGGLVAYRVTAPVAPDVTPTLTEIGTANIGFTTSMGLVDGRVVATVIEGAQTRIVELQMDSITNLVIGVRDIVRHPAMYGQTGNAPAGPGAWVVSDGVYLGECRNIIKRGEMLFVPIADEAGLLKASDALNAGVAQPESRVLACSTLADGSMAWVQREGSGVERVLTWKPQDLQAPAEVLVLPPTLLGVGQTSDTELPGVLDLQPGDGGDWIFLLANRQPSAGALDHGLTVARWQSSDDTWHLGDAFGISTALEFGELCLGPMTTCADGFGTHGCGPAACPVSSSRQEQRASVRPQAGYLVREGGDVHVFYEVKNTERTPGVLFAGFELQHVRVPAP
ncbi:hypothetical protein [Bradymonas sediminis]|uniref:Uncharacterized protein n=1 Tax=Bradymonas sediminis TaxID=1548548 RepID=A0A2Z4FGV7_9DELT|nr:hypothetical protein [Bradymonas sediminis]AWV88193.1 hypothetical protein DN745_02105 [Bradymonas sediminis]TDP77317.1 hypothetical protein DFR33_101217 [Bradymonas sediminis]